MGNPPVENFLGSSSTGAPFSKEAFGGDEDGEQERLGLLRSDEEYRIIREIILADAANIGKKPTLVFEGDKQTNKIDYSSPGLELPTGIPRTEREVENSKTVKGGSKNLLKNLCGKQARLRRKLKAWKVCWEIKHCELGRDLTMSNVSSMVHKSIIDD